MAGTLPRHATQTGGIRLNSLKDAITAIKEMIRTIHAARVLGLEKVQTDMEQVQIVIDGYNNVSIATRSWSINLQTTYLEQIADHLDIFMAVAAKAKEHLECQVGKTKAARELLAPFYMEEKLNPKGGSGQGSC